MALGKPAITTPNKLDARAVQLAVSNTRQRIEALEAAIATLQGQTITLQNASSSTASAAELASLQSQITALAARVTVLENITLYDLIHEQTVMSGAEAGMMVPAAYGGSGYQVDAFDIAALLLSHPPFNSGSPPGNSLVPVRLPDGSVALVTSDSIGGGGPANLQALIDALPASSNAEADAEVPGTRGGVAYRFNAFDIANLLLSHSPYNSGAERTAVVPARLSNGMTVLISVGDIAGLAPTADLVSLINGFSASSGAEANAQIPAVSGGSTGLRMSAYDIAALLLTHSPYSSGSESSAIVPVMLTNGTIVTVTAADLVRVTLGTGADGTYLSMVGGAYTWAIAQIAKAPAFSATPTFDTSTADVFTPGAMTANITALNFSGTRPKVIIALLQDNVGGRTVAAGTSIDFGTDIPNLNGISLVANAYTYLGFVYHPTTGKYRLVALSK